MFLLNFVMFCLIHAMPFEREAQHLSVEKLNFNKQSSCLTLAFKTTLAGVKQRKILEFKVSVQKKRH